MKKLELAAAHEISTETLKGRENPIKGSPSFQKWINFQKISERGGGILFHLKNFVAKFLALKRHLGWGQRPVGNFPELYPFLKRQASLTITIPHICQ